MQDGSDAESDWPVLNALLNVANGQLDRRPQLSYPMTLKLRSKKI
jgi:hypothetical protein